MTAGRAAVKLVLDAAGKMQRKGHGQHIEQNLAFFLTGVSAAIPAGDPAPQSQHQKMPPFLAFLHCHDLSNIVIC
jgi:hypothetical protein